MLSRSLRRGQWFFAVTIVLAAVALWAPATDAQEPTPETPATATPEPSPDPTPSPTPDPTAVPTSDPTPTPTPDPTPAPTPTPAPSPAGTLGPVVFGAGTTTLGEDFPAEYLGDQIFVALHARILPDQTIGGIFTVTHHKPNGDLFAEVRGEISCLRVEGEHAIATGVITVARTPGLPGGELREGLMAGIVVRDGGAERDRIAWTFGEAGPDCTELPAVTVADVEYGNFVVHP
jgi:hypothetical protein